MRNKTILKSAEISIGDFLKIEPMLGVVFYHFVQYAVEYDLPVVITSMIDEAPNRVSSTHNEGRAIDIRASKEWTDLHTVRVCNKLNELYARKYGTAPAEKKPRVIICHDAGTGKHFHLQIRRNLILFK